MLLTDLRWGYDWGTTEGKEKDGYLNVEAQIEEEGKGKRYVWLSRSDAYETVTVSEQSMFSIAMHMIHADADFDMEYDWISKHALEYYEYELDKEPDEKIRKSRYYQIIRFCDEVLNQCMDWPEDKKDMLIRKVYKKMNMKKEVLHNL